MSKQHRIGGKRAKGFAALSKKRRGELASLGGKAVATSMFPGYMAALGRHGAAVRYGKKEAA